MPANSPIPVRSIFGQRPLPKKVLLRRYYLEFDLGFSNILFASTPSGDLLCFGDLRPYRLTANSISGFSLRKNVITGRSYFRTEIFKRKSLNGVDAELRAGLHDCKASRNYTGPQLADDITLRISSSCSVDAVAVCIASSSCCDVRKNCLLPPLSSMTSTSPGFNCSIDGTWFASIPISPDSAGRLT